MLSSGRLWEGQSRWPQREVVRHAEVDSRPSDEHIDAYAAKGYGEPCLLRVQAGIESNGRGESREADGRSGATVTTEEAPSDFPPVSPRVVLPGRKEEAQLLVYFFRPRCPYVTESAALRCRTHGADRPSHERCRLCRRAGIRLANPKTGTCPFGSSQGGWWRTGEVQCIGDGVESAVLGARAFGPCMGIFVAHHSQRQAVVCVRQPATTVCESHSLHTSHRTRLEKPPGTKADRATRAAFRLPPSFLASPHRPSPPDFRLVPLLTLDVSWWIRRVQSLMKQRVHIQLDIRFPFTSRPLLSSPSRPPSSPCAR